MVFSSTSFLFLFLPIFMAVYFLAPSLRAKNLATLFFSLTFYGWGEPWFVLVLLASIAFNTVAALRIDERTGSARTSALAFCITVNLSLLAVFKYAGFVVGNLNVILDSFGFIVPVPKIALPLGISFFTFHCLSYLIDVYRGRFAANRDPVEVALYISLFPQLVAGPIVRYKTVARQLRSRRHTLGRASIGVRIFIIGLAQKVLIADQVAQIVDAVFDHTKLPSMAEAWLGLLAYTLQIYFDFAGYSNMAIGLGLVLGFTFPRNFRLPYAAQSITEFWRRWHISLSSWLRDYLYIPLGGSRNGALRTYRNLATVFVLCGLWHGASWTFVLWGVWQGASLVIERVELGRLLLYLPPLGRCAYTLLIVMFGWVLFRANDLKAAGRMYGSLFGQHGVGGIGFELHSVLSLGVLLPLFAGCILAFSPKWPKPKVPDVTFEVVRAAWSFCLLVATVIYVAAGVYSPFLYFRF
jgi:D-alanyl-lipoteichoic acid acyltransferase DltB (MBOAT superfamily)